MATTAKAQTISDLPSFERGRSTVDRTKLPLYVKIFLLGLVIPLYFYLGTIRLSTFRMVLLLLFVPSVFVLLSGKAGKIRTPDICVFVICVWSSVSLIYHHGLVEKIEPIGIFFVDTLGAYLIGRCYIRTSEAFFKMVRLLIMIMLVLTPFAVYETITGINVLLKIFDAIGNTPMDVFKERRLGLDRVQGPFGHPIHWGVFFGALVGVTHYVIGYGRHIFLRLLGTITVMLVGALALSSGPLAALTAQALFIAWDWMFRRFKYRWYVLGGLSVLAYIVVDFLSNRNPFEVFIHYLAFNPFTAANRILIFEWGMKNIMDNPIFGIGHNPWEKLSWMTPSFDMFWLVYPMQHGVLVGLMYMLLFFWIFLKVAFKKISNPKISSYRVGYLSSMVGFFMSGWTVHLWDPTFVFLLFFLGCGVWFVDYDSSLNEVKIPPDTSPDTRIRYSRFRTAPSLDA